MYIKAKTFDVKSYHKNRSQVVYKNLDNCKKSNYQIKGMKRSYYKKVQKTKPVPPNKVAAAVRGRDFQASHQTRTVVTKTITVEIIVIIMTEIIKNLQIEMMMMEK